MNSLQFELNSNTTERHCCHSFTVATAKNQENLVVKKEKDIFKLMSESKSCHMLFFFYDVRRECSAVSLVILKRYLEYSICCNTVKKDLDCSAAELVFGQTMKLPGQFHPNISKPVTPLHQRLYYFKTIKVFKENYIKHNI